MASASFTAFITLPDVITGPGMYLTRCGEAVRVRVASDKHNFNCRGQYANGVAEGWHKSGRLLFGTETCNDIVSHAYDDGDVDEDGTAAYNRLYAPV